MRKLGWGLMALLSSVIAIYGFMLLVLPGARPPFMHERFAVMPMAAYLHLSGASVALLVGPLQLSARIRNSSLNRHRWMGRAYLIGILAGGLGGIALATVSQGGLPAHLGFATLGLLWLAFTMLAYRAIRSGDEVRHRRWMYRSFALTFGAVMLRLYLPLSSLAGIPFEPAYRAIAWLCWAPNLLVAEWFLASETRYSAARSPGLQIR